jgi:hypothetical protein
MRAIFLSAGTAILLFAFAILPGSGCKTQSGSYRISGGNGLTREQAVIIQARDIGIGTAAELTWLKNNCPQYRAVTNKFEAASGHIFSVVTLTSTNGETKLIYFDLTDPIRNSPRRP